MRAIEIEFKYNADDISLLQFNVFCAARGEAKYFEASGFDHFFENPKEPDTFYRHRIGTSKNELTLKCKKVSTNNFIRDEDNIELHKKTSRIKVQDWLLKHDYHYNTSIFKNCFIYEYDTHTLVYYICYDSSMKELGRFIEIEMSEEHDWANEQEAWDVLLVVEKACKPLGLSVQCRVKRSLWEMFRKDTK